MPKTVAVYVRVSTDDKGQSTENQEMDLTQLCAREGFKVHAVYSDTVSGSGEKKRPGYERLMKDAEAHKFNLILFWSLDRFSREGVYPTLEQLRKLASYGVEFRSFTEPYLDTSTPMGEMILSILACLAKQERIRISERVRAGLRRTVSAGTKLGRKKKEVDAKLLDQCAASGMSVREVAKLVGVSVATAHRLLTDRKTGAE